MPDCVPGKGRPRPPTQSEAVVPYLVLRTTEGGLGCHTGTKTSRVLGPEEGGPGASNAPWVARRGWD